MFSGPQPRPNPYGGFYRKQTLCNFTYVHRRLNPTNEYAVGVILRAQHTDKEILQSVEEAADKLAEKVAEGKKLEAVYTFDAGTLSPGFPK